MSISIVCYSVTKPIFYNCCYWLFCVFFWLRIRRFQVWTLAGSLETTHA